MDDFGFLCREEHLRWVKEKLSMGWKYGTSYISENGKVNYALRQQRKEHCDIVPFECLTKDEQEKDTQLIKNMVPLLYKLGGNTHIYRYRYGRKPDINIAAIGHRSFVNDREELKKQIKEILAEYNRNYRVIALWDGVERRLYDAEGNPTNRGGTYHCLTIAKERGFTDEDIHIIPIER